ncbi:DUF2267 domain-containing protein [Streptomyces rapamycinicus]|uniref:DUF2267 domain-containing protein n=2 Tax=Streptomyces rapamycinicus TaxID=1226757 RepID=A0A0A0N871_STRRN|nr:DUF2267 domain-containing protein [Streptomyces rapamycinicus]AGP52839.1 hypothetical protein M271_06065 [Streptomyces rapamycinicus NRRL 5491]MBB4780313.1 uncharacterized protein (DUF2267 family) [Streptomyces rapamycinicus]RLV75032.1 hypothetical protein D3C57_137440 [Streptomyces rapamycinicus NRRL 5491]UTO61047.1 DUF2267 domain-containing protein [Streptomyces rapamycinicus]UTP28991.1 DUF2267 domain-containing protein [Streptomyces rapamycinicus NRRL 5491]
MDDREFFQTVAERTQLSRQEAADVTRATLETLAARLSAGEARDLAQELPGHLRESLRRGPEEMEIFDPEESVRRVHLRTGLSEPEADRGVRAVLATLREAVSAEEYGHAMSQLGGEFARMAESVR